MLYLFIPLIFSAVAEGRQRKVNESDVLKAARHCGIDWEIEVERAIGDANFFWWRTKRGALKVVIETADENDQEPLPQNRDYQGCLDRWAKKRGVSVNRDLGLVQY